MTAPRGFIDKEKKGLDYLGCEVTWGSQWINLNDGVNYRITGGDTKETRSKTWRKTVVESPVLGGNYLVHAVPDMVQEQVGVWIYGSDQTDLHDKLHFLEEIFEQWSYRIRWTYDEYREYWNCQLAESSISQGHVWTHSKMAKAIFTIPRYANITKETLA